MLQARFSAASLFKTARVHVLHRASRTACTNAHTSSIRMLGYVAPPSAAPLGTRAVSSAVASNATTLANMPGEYQLVDFSSKLPEVTINIETLKAGKKYDYPGDMLVIPMHSVRHSIFMI
jgi:hypothetical protein